MRKKLSNLSEKDLSFLYRAIRDYSENLPDECGEHDGFYSDEMVVDKKRLTL